MLEWIQKEVGEIFGHGFVFAPEHLSDYHQQICVNAGLWLIICPKKRPPDGEVKDTVDETLIEFGEIQLRHPDIDCVCLVSGDDDFVPFMEKARELGIKRALVAPTLSSLSKSQKLISTADENPATRQKMVLILDDL